MQGIRWNLGDGRKVNFWWDCWALEDKPLIFYAQQPLPVELINSTVSKCVNGDGSWNWGLVANLLPNNVILRIAAIKPPLNNVAGMRLDGHILKHGFSQSNQLIFL